MSQDSNHKRILRNRYYHLLNPLTDIDSVTETLYSREIITTNEKDEIMRASSHENKRHTLCQALTGKGIDQLVEISHVLKNEQKRQSSTGCHSNYTDITNTNSSTTSFSSTSSSSEDSNGSSGRSEARKSDLNEDSREVPQGKQPPPAGRNVCLSVEDTVKTFPKHKYSDSESHQQRAEYSRWNVLVNDKHQKTDVPDPPLEILTPSPHGSSPHHMMAEAFIVLFYTFIVQQLQYFWKNSDKNPSHLEQNASYSSNTYGEYSSPAVSQLCNKVIFPWLQVDLQLESASDYFPAEIIKGIIPSSSNPASMRLSVILEAFQQYFHAFEQMRKENQSLQRKAKMFDEVLKKNKLLEAKLKQMQSSGQFSPICVNLSDDVTSQGRVMQEKIADLEEQMRQVEPLQKAYIRSEERCKQLVEVTQQWAIECDEKVNLIKVYEEENKQLKSQVEQLERRVAKYKKFWTDTKDQPKRKVPDSQFEELRNELAFRRELYDQVVAQRDEATKKVKALTQEVEELRDHNAQLSDRAANFKVQAQAKEPSVREMSNLLELNGKLESHVEKLKSEKSELSDKIVALELLVEDLKQNPQRPENPLSGPNPHPKKTQAMVTGRDLPNRAAQFPPGINPPPNHQLLPLSSRDPPHSPGLGASPPHYRPTNPPSSAHDEDDIASLLSSEGEAAFLSFGSTSDKKHSVRSRDDLKGASDQRNMNSQSGLSQSHDIGSLSHDITSQSHDHVPIDDEGDGDEDYTRRIQYPKHSKIHIQPLLNEDIVLKSESQSEVSDQGPPPTAHEDDKITGEKEHHLGSGASPGKKSPIFYDRSYFDPYRIRPDMQRENKQQERRVAGQPTMTPSKATNNNPPLSSFASKEKKCPVCQHAFITLSESEFQSHVALCFK